MNRRQFIKISAALAVTSIYPFSVEADRPNARSLLGGATISIHGGTMPRNGVGEEGRVLLVAKNVGFISPDRENLITTTSVEFDTIDSGIATYFKIESHDGKFVHRGNITVAGAQLNASNTTTLEESTFTIIPQS